MKDSGKLFIKVIRGENIQKNNWWYLTGNFKQLFIEVCFGKS